MPPPFPPEVLPSMELPVTVRAWFARLVSSFESNHTPPPLPLAVFREMVLSLTTILIRPLNPASDELLYVPGA